MSRRRKRSKTQTESFQDRVKSNPQKPNVLLEGDSWFGFLPWDNISNHVKATGKYNVHDVSNSGEEMLDMLSGKSRMQLIRSMKACQFDYILWSGGGNDIFSNLYFFLNGDSSNALPKRFKNKVNQLEQAYFDLCYLRDEYCPAAKIITHEYDYVYDTGKSIDIGPLTVAGPWLKPSLDALGVPLDRRKELLRMLIETFSVMLERVELSNKNFVVAKTQGTLKQEHWNDELHPNQEGFKLISQKMIDLMNK